MTQAGPANLVISFAWPKKIFFSVEGVTGSRANRCVSDLEIISDTGLTFNYSNHLVGLYKISLSKSLWLLRLGFKRVMCDNTMLSLILMFWRNFEITVHIK